MDIFREMIEKYPIQNYFPNGPTERVDASSINFEEALSYVKSKFLKRAAEAGRQADDASF